MSSANVLVLGSGAREDALGKKLLKDRSHINVYHYPGNGGTYLRNITPPVLEGEDLNEHEEVLRIVEEYAIDLVVIGPEKYLESGLVDYLKNSGICRLRVFGPTQNAARIETDKFFSYEVMNNLRIPQARGVMCYTHEEVRNAITHGKWWDGDNPGVVLKARGLAGGKGVRVCDFQEEALAAADAIVQSYGTQILVCEKLSGPEFSVFAICDGKKAWGFDAAFQDYKRLYDNDLGPNTGGMGAFGPVHLPQHLILQTHEYMQRVVEELEFTGFLYAGMMLTSEGPKCLEFNARFGDPECQPAMVLLENDLFDLLWKATSEVGLPKDTAIKFKDGYAVCVVLTDKGYPHKLRDQGAVIEGIRSDWHSHNPCCWIYHGGTEREGESYELKKKHVVSGGRVLSVVGYGDDPELARFRAYKGAKGLTIPGGFYHRKDIAK